MHSHTPHTCRTALACTFPKHLRPRSAAPTVFGRKVVVIAETVVDQTLFGLPFALLSLLQQSPGVRFALRTQLVLLLLQTLLLLLLQGGRPPALLRLLVRRRRRRRRRLLRSRSHRRAAASGSGTVQQHVAMVLQLLLGAADDASRPPGELVVDALLQPVAMQRGKVNVREAGHWGDRARVSFSCVFVGPCSKCTRL